MHIGGRARRAFCGSALPTLLCLHLSFQNAISAEYGVPVEIKLWDTGRTPLAHMVDVTNGFGLKVLAEHNFLNDNNIAFSPYGLMGILVALFEGIDGESSYQIQRAMQLPWNRNVMRIGFRDIHRTLKTYFVPEEGFLAGLALNNENVTFDEGYKKVLRFYGFDLDNEQLPTTIAPVNGTNETTTAAPAATTLAAGSPSTMDAGTTQSREVPTTNPNAETINDVDIRSESTTLSPSSAPNAESTTPMMPSSTERATEETLVTTQAPQTTTLPSSTTLESTTEETTTTPTTTSQTETESIPPQPSSTVALTDEPTANNEVSATTADMSASTIAETTVTTVSESAATTETTSTTSETQSTEMPTSTTLTDESTTIPSDSTLETLQRRKKSIVDFIFTNPPYEPYVDEYLFHRSYDIPIGPDQGSPSYDGNRMFLANGLRNVQVTYMHYDTILEHGYLPHLEASALRLPLDSDRYYLLVVLPNRGGAPELGRLLARMARESDLSDVCSALRLRRVRAIVPSFTVKGHVTLTTDLQKLGIRDVFEPRQRDFTPMTHQAGVYVRSIEQAVSVAIRKYRDTDANSSRYVTNRHPVSFSATYPFLYFVMDSSIHVALMAGKMVDPLNSRIL